MNTVAILYFIAGICWYMAAIIGRNPTNIALGSMFTCLGSIYLIRAHKKKKNKN